MTDPKVTIDEVIARAHTEFKLMRLIYEVVDPGSLQDVPPMEFEGPEFVGRLAEGTLVLAAKVDFGASLQTAMAHADEFLRVWEIAAGVRLDRAPLEFRFGHAEASCKDAATGTPVDFITASVPEFIEIELQVPTSIGVYPEPPSVPRADQRAELLWIRYRRYLEGKAELLARAFACLSILTAGRKRRATARGLAVEFRVLDGIGYLSSERGSETEARKFSGKNKPMTKDEEMWLRNALKAIIMHLLVPVPGRVLTLDEIWPKLLWT